MGPCPACGAGLSPWITVPAGEPSDTRRFDLARCDACGTAVTTGPPPGPEAYEQGIYAPESARPVVARALQRATVGQPVRALKRSGLRAGARVLDAGAGRGRLVHELRRRGFDAQGIDASARQARGAIRRSSIADHEARGLDAVVLWHVAEHLDDPLSALGTRSGWLAPGGLVLLGVPNAASAASPARRAGVDALGRPRHRQHFTPAGVDALLGRAGLDPVRVEHMVWEYNPASMWMALLSRLGVSPAYAFHALKGNAPRRGRDLAHAAWPGCRSPVALAAEAAARSRARRGRDADRRVASGA